MGNSSVWLNFNLNVKNKIDHYSWKEHPKISVDNNRWNHVWREMVQISARNRNVYRIGKLCKVIISALYSIRDQTLQLNYF